MYKSGLVQESQPVQQLLGEDSNKGSAQPSELILLDEFIKVYTKQFKDKT